MLAITCFSFPLTDWTDGLDLLSRGGEPDITGSKTISNEVQEVRLDVCLTALLLLPLLFIPNIIEKELEEVRKEVKRFNRIFSLLTRKSSECTGSKRLEPLHRHSAAANSTNSSNILETSSSSPSPD